MAARLDRRTVVVTRGKGGEDALSARLRALGAEVREVPSIAFADPADPGPLDGALRALDRFEWAVFTSATAVDRTVARLLALGLEVAALARLRLAAVGPATAERLARAVREPDLVPGEAKGDALARALAPHVRGRRVLFPRPAEGRPETVAGLLAAGAELTAVEAYRTVPAPAEAIAPLGDWLARGEIDAVAFASPSAVRAVVSALGERAALLRDVLLAAIGPTTAEALREHGLAPGAEPERYTGADLAEAVAARLGPG
ncbi:uroporphyrinogen-III synthase [Anaeromyxobacter terrae]|uniref:uroporphyrinogen-III synthase n=1 Tax=Anaeromyxobacter terrae TaxID=2925406 RepID=UPI001F58E022|nr:uroporphyrinogen-III synthase [Anaeromyxobacter sp. SG22]